MRLIIVSASISLVIGAVGSFVDRSLLVPRWIPETPCGFSNPSSNSKAHATVKRMQQQEQIVKRNTGRIEINVNLHAALPTNASGDYVSIAELKRQYDILRQAYKPYGIRMNLDKITRIKNNALSNMEPKFDDDGALSGASKEIEDYWKSHRTGDYKELHIFVYDKMPGITGLCNLPDEDLPESKYYLDACHILASSVPGNGEGIWDAGETAVHEVGHWFGLLHVWSQSCDDDGDFVADTPQQKEVSFGECPEDKDTCPDKPGKDNVHNYMDYAGDDCAEEFTPGQKARMHSMFQSIRAKKDKAR